MTDTPTRKPKRRRERGDGSIIKRGENKFLLKFDVPPGPDGKRQQRYETVHGTRDAAKQRLNAILKDLRDKTHVDGNKVTVAEKCRGWIDLARVRGLSPKTAERYGQLIENQIAAYPLGASLLQNIDTGAIKQWFKALIDSGLHPRTVGHAHQVLFLVLADAAQDRQISKVTLADLREAKAPPLPDSEAQALTADQAQRLLAAVKGRSIYLPVAIALGTGARRGEILALRWNDLDFDAGRMRIDESLEQTKKGGIRAKRPKTKSGVREISLPASLTAELRAHRKECLEQRIALGQGKMPDDGFVFAHIDGSPRSPEALTREWSRTVRSAKIVPDVFSFHSLRHTHASQLLAAGVDVVTVAKRLGHRDASITLKVYSHYIPGGDERAAQAIENAIGTLGKP